MKRPDDDRPARLMKLDAIRTLATESEVVLVVDDDPRVVNLLANHGFRARLANWCPWSPRNTRC